VKGVVVQKEKTRTGERVRIKTRSWAFIPNEVKNDELNVTQEAQIEGKKKGDIFIAETVDILRRINPDRVFKSVKNFAIKNGFRLIDDVSPALKQMLVYLYLMNRKAVLKKYLSWDTSKQWEYVKNPFLFYLRNYMDFHSTLVLSKVTLRPLFLKDMVGAYGYFVLTEAYKDGRESLPLKEFMERVSEVAKVSVEEVKVVFSDFFDMKKQRFVFDSDRAYLSKIFYLKKKCLTILERNPFEPYSHAEDNENINELIKWKYSILTGGPGTGKTTLLKAIGDRFKNTILSATTGKAAKRLGSEAVTIHSLLGYSRNGFAVKELNCDMLIVDEASMFDWMTLHAILTSASRVIFSGDPKQLPPIEGESVFLKMLEIVPVITLEKAYRFINKKDNVKEYIVESDTDGLVVIKKIVRLLKERQKKFQVITPVHSGLLGTRCLNKVLQNVVNPDGKNPNPLRKGDKVIVTKNVYKNGKLIVSNGQMGMLEKDNGDTVIIKIDNELIEIESDCIKLAYALTVHKFQGSEADYVVFAMPSYVGREFLTDEMVFVGTTRGRVRTFVVKSGG